MGDVRHDGKMSEIERIEFNRRKDIAQSVIWAAEPYLLQKAELDKRVKQESKALASIWYWALLGIGASVHYLFNESEPNLGSWVMVAVVLMWIGRRVDLGQASVKRERCQEKLEELAATWGSVANGSFWDINEFVNDTGLVLDNAFRNWWTEKQKGILERVCGFERAALIALD